MNYLIVDDNKRYFDELEKHFKARNLSIARLVYSVENKNWISELYQKLYDLRKANKGICLIINSEIKIHSKLRSEAEGFLLALEILSSSILDFQGRIILCGFVPKECLTRIVSGMALKKYLKKSDKLSYLSLPANEYNWKDKLSEK